MSDERVSMEYGCQDDVKDRLNDVIDSMKAELTRLRAALEVALKYGAPADTKAMGRKSKCAHNEYWTTISGACMACRAEKAENALSLAQMALRQIRTYENFKQDGKVDAYVTGGGNETDIPALLGHIAALQVELSVAETEIESLKGHIADQNERS